VGIKLMRLCVDARLSGDVTLSASRRNLIPVSFALQTSRVQRLFLLLSFINAVRAGVNAR